MSFTVLDTELILHVGPNINGVGCCCEATASSEGQFFIGRERHVTIEPFHDPSRPGPSDWG